MTYQVWNGYSWVDYRYSSNSDFYTDRISSFDYQVVESYKYYRLVVTHFINDYGVTSYVVTTTDYLYVN